MKDQLLKYSGAAAECACPGCQQSQWSEEMQRPCREVEQKLDAQKIQKHVQRSRDAIVRLTVLAGRGVDGDLRNPRSGPGCESRDETVEFAVELNALNCVAAIRLEGRAEIVERHSGEPG